MNIKKTVFELRYLMNTQENAFLEDDIISSSPEYFCISEATFPLQNKTIDNSTDLYTTIDFRLPITVAARSKA
jgi:hypothetical protein